MGIIKNYSSLNTSAQRKIVLDFIEEGLNAIQPQNIINKEVNLENNILYLNGQSFDLNKFENVYLLGFGKGSGKISQLIENKLEDKLTKGYVIDTVETEFKKIKFTLGTHPLPSQVNLDFTKQVIEEFSNLTSKDLVLVIICGGGSVMFESPISIDLNKLIEINQKLLESGANILEMNTLRKHLSKVKGGGLVEILNPAKIISLIFSDVLGNDLSFIASGPTVLDKTTTSDALAIYEKYNLDLNLNNQDLAETPKDEKIFNNTTNILMLSNLTALNAIQKKAEELNIKVNIFSDKFSDDANNAAEKLINETKPNSLLIAGGETTLHVTNPNGKGGRNQATVLAGLFKLPEKTIIASFDSDGWDNSEVCGAIGDNLSLEKAKSLGINPHDLLMQNNSLVFFENIGDAIITDKLPSNVSDLFLVYRYE